MDLSMSLPVHVKHHESHDVEEGEVDAYLAVKPGHRLALCLSVSRRVPWELEANPRISRARLNRVNLLQQPGCPPPSRASPGCCWPALSVPPGLIWIKGKRVLLSSWVESTRRSL